MRALGQRQEAPPVSCRPAPLAGLGLALFACAWACLWHRSLGGFWLPDGILLVCLVRATSPRVPQAVVGLLALTGAALAAGMPLGSSLVLGASHVVEAGVAAWLLHTSLAPRADDLSGTDAFAKLLPVALLVPLPGGLLAVASHSPDAVMGYLAHALGLLCVAPVVSTDWSKAPRRAEVAALALAASSTGALLVWLHASPWLFLTVPFTMLAACRAGQAASALTSGMALLGGLAVLSPTDLGSTTLSLQVLTMTGLLTAFPVSSLFETKASSERALRHEVERFDDLASHLPVGVYTLCMPPVGPLRFDYANPTMARLLGVSQEDVLRDLETAYRNAHEDDVDALRQKVAESRETLEPFRQEARFIVNGDVRWLRIESMPRTTPDGGSMWDGSVTDLTDRKLAEEALLCHLKLRQMEESASSTELLQFAVDEAQRLTGSTIGFFHLIEDDQQTLKAQTWSSSTLSGMCQVQGALEHLPVSEGGAWAECVHTRRPVVHNDYPSMPDRRGHPSGHVPLLRELIVPVADTKVRALLAVGNRSAPYDERHVAIVSNIAEVAWEITTRKKSQTSLIESERLLKALVEASPLAIVTFRAEGPIVSANASSARLVGAPMEAVLKQNFRELESWKQSGLLDTALRALDSGSEQSIETLTTTSYGKTSWLSARFVPFELEGRPHLLLVGEDVTRRKQDEADLKAYAETQAVLLREVNHRVANNLSAILAIVHLEQARAADEGQVEAAETLAVLETRVQSLSMVHSLLASGEWQPVGLRDLCAELVANATLIDDRQRLRVEEEGPPVRVQAEQAHSLALILSELATNSLKYGRSLEGGPRVEIHIVREGDDVVLTYRDHGPGFDVAVLAGDRRNVGMSLMRGLVQHTLRGKLQLSNDNGACVRMQFPILVKGRGIDER